MKMYTYWIRTCGVWFNNKSWTKTWESIISAKYLTKDVKDVVFESLKVLTSYSFYRTYVLYFYYINKPVKLIS